MICEDADLDLALDVCVQARLINAGQSCISPKRLIVSERIYSKFRDGLLARVKDLRMADPRLESTQLAPLARLDLRDQLDKQVKASVAQGARCLLGGEIPSGKGFFYSCSVLENVSTAMPAFSQELFGPVFVLLSARDDKVAVSLANQTSYGLGAAVFSKEQERAKALASELNAGTVAINRLVRSDPAVAFGGIKQSGYGRELGDLGLHEFANIKATLF